jgi:hypothetical protein
MALGFPESEFGIIGCFNINKRYDFRKEGDAYDLNFYKVFFDYCLKP